MELKALSKLLVVLQQHKVSRFRNHDNNFEIEFCQHETKENLTPAIGFQPSFSKSPNEDEETFEAARERFIKNLCQNNDEEEPSVVES